MTNLTTPGFQLLTAFLFFLLLQSTQILSYQYKVGDLDAWNIPTSANPLVYAKWSKFHTFRIGDSLLFLYPPSQDSVLQVTKASYDTCSLKDPLLHMNDGNSLFNITENGDFYFTSGYPGHCGKKQKLHIVVGNGSASSADSPAYGPSAMADSAAAPSYPTNFGSIPTTSSSSSQLVSSSMVAAAGFLIYAFIKGIL